MVIVMTAVIKLRRTCNARWCLGYVTTHNWNGSKNNDCNRKLTFFPTPALALDYLSNLWLGFGHQSRWEPHYSGLISYIPRTALISDTHSSYSEPEFRKGPQKLGCVQRGEKLMLLFCPASHANYGLEFVWYYWPRFKGLYLIYCHFLELPNAIDTFYQ